MITQKLNKRLTIEALIQEKSRFLLQSRFIHMFMYKESLSNYMGRKFFLT